MAPGATGRARAGTPEIATHSEGCNGYTAWSWGAIADKYRGKKPSWGGRSRPQLLEQPKPHMQHLCPRDLLSPNSRRGDGRAALPAVGGGHINIHREIKSAPGSRGKEVKGNVKLLCT